MARELKRYRRVSLQTWGDKKFRELSRPAPNAQTLWLFLITGPHTSAIPGLLHVGQAGLAESLSWSLPALRRCWQEIADKEMGEANWDAPLIWLPNALKHNPPESLNVVKSWATTFDTLPECALKAKAEAYIQAFLQAKGQGFAEAFGLGMVHTGTGSGTGTGTETESALPKHPIFELLAIHDHEFQAKYREKPARYTGKDAKHAEMMIAQHGFIRAGAIVRQFFASNDPFIAKSGHAMGVLANATVQNKVIAELVTKRQAQQPAAVPKSHPALHQSSARRFVCGGEHKATRLTCHGLSARLRTPQRRDCT